MDKDFVDVIESAIVQRKINTNIIKSYVKIIQAKSYLNLIEIIKILAE